MKWTAFLNFLSFFFLFFFLPPEEGVHEGLLVLGVLLLGHVLLGEGRLLLRHLMQVHTIVQFTHLAI